MAESQTLAGTCLGNKIQDKNMQNDLLLVINKWDGQHWGATKQRFFLSKQEEFMLFISISYYNHWCNKVTALNTRYIGISEDFSCQWHKIVKCSKISKGLLHFLPLYLLVTRWKFELIWEKLGTTICLFWITL